MMRCLKIKTYKSKLTAVMRLRDILAPTFNYLTEEQWEPDPHSGRYSVKRQDATDKLQK